VKHQGPWELSGPGTVTPPAGVLIRPDGRVAWVGDGPVHGLAGAMSPPCVPRDEGGRAPGSSSFWADPDLPGRRSHLFETGAIVLHVAQRHAGLFLSHMTVRHETIEVGRLGARTGAAAHL
jgi:hypothetical protein